MAVFTSALTRDAPLTELFGNLLILETIPAPERRIRGARGALSYDAGRVRLLTFWTVPLVEAGLAARLIAFFLLCRLLIANNALRTLLPPAFFASKLRVGMRLHADLTHQNRSRTLSSTTRFP